MDADEFRRCGHRLVDLLADYYEGVADKALFPDVEPGHLEAIFEEELPRGGMDAERVLDLVEEKLLPYCTHVSHPGYFGLITPTPTPMGVLGDFLSSALNQNIGTYTIGPSAVAMERRTVRWLCELVGWGEESGGHLTSGGTMANFEALKFARDFASGERAQHEGVREPWGVYVSEERHVSLDKAVDCVGTGRESMRAVLTDDDFRVRLDLLEQAIAQDKERGVRPMCVIGLAGTTNTGSVDDFAALRAIADRERMWLHADAAYGGGMLLSQRDPDVLKGLELADSVTIDPHKWFYAPLDAGAILVRDRARLTRSYGMQPSYLTDEMDTSGERFQYYVHSFEQSRRFRGLKVWMSFQRYGADTLGEWIDANVAQAQRLAALVEGTAHFHLAVRPRMSAVCLRYDPGGIPEDELTRIHRKVARQVEDEGRFWISTTVLKDAYWFRINPVNFRTRIEHMDELFELLRTKCARAKEVGV